MPTRKINSEEKAFLKKLGKKIEQIILKEKKYRSLDSFALEFSDLIAKPTLYQICQGKRDMKVTTMRRLAIALELDITNLMK